MIDKIVNKNCPICKGQGKIKTIKEIAHIGPFHLGKESLSEDCTFCQMNNFNEEKEERVIH